MCKSYYFTHHHLITHILYNIVNSVILTLILTNEKLNLLRSMTVKLAIYLIQNSYIICKSLSVVTHLPLKSPVFNQGTSDLVFFYLGGLGNFDLEQNGVK